MLVSGNRFMAPFRRLRNNRQLALLIATFFAAISLLATLPHDHDRDSKACPESLTAAQSILSVTPNCFLCDYHNLTFITPTAPATLDQFIGDYNDVAPAESDSPYCLLSVPHRSLRAPPFRS